MKTIHIHIITICLLIACLPFTPLYTKLRAFSASHAGVGARSQWVLQAEKLSKSVPVTGYGVDTLSRYLKPAKGPYHEEHVICDKTHNLMFDIILQLGWIGYTFSLLTFGAALAVTLKNPIRYNVTLFSSVSAWVVFSMANPSGIWAMLVAMVCLLGIKEKAV